MNILYRPRTLVGGCLIAALVLVLSTSANSEAAPQDSEAKPDSIEALVRQSFESQMKEQRERIERAEAELQEIRKEFERRSEAADEIIARRVRELLGKSDTSVDESADLLSAEGWQAWRSREWRTALGKFKEAVELDPKHVAALNGLGWTQVHLGHYENAIKTFREALKIEPQHAGAMNGLGQSLMALGRLDEAEKELLQATLSSIDEFGEAVAIKSNVTASWFGLVQVLIRQEKLDEAKVWANRYLKHDPGQKVMQGLLEQASGND
jgi:Flp pilus assembly protein TadD